MRIPKSTWILVLILRIACSLLIKNVLIPDEVYQSVEIATILDSGLGYSTWEWKERIRGFLLPLIFSTIFKLSRLLNLSEYRIIICRVFMSILLTINDFVTVKLGSKLFGEDLEPWILLSSIFNFCHWILGYRWLGNTFEMFGITLSLYWWPITKTITSKNISYAKLALSLLVGGFVCILRPTSALIYIYLGLDLLLKCPTIKQKILITAMSSILVILMICMMIFLDTKYYKEFTFVPIEFLKFNVFKGISSYYGVHNILWYLYSGLPTILVSWLPFTIYGFYSKRTEYSVKFFFRLSLLLIGAFSLLPHKEFRFIYPLLPILVIMSAIGLKLVIDKYPDYFAHIVIALIITNLLPGIYVNQYHHRATLPIMNHLKLEIDNMQVKSIGFLIPCHTTPFYSHLQRDVPMWFLTCNPNLNHDPNYLDSEDLFYKDPVNFINSKFKQGPIKKIKEMKAGEDFEYYWPSHLVVFQHLLDLKLESEDGYAKFEDYVKAKGYKLDREFWNSHFSTTRRSGNLVVLKRT